MFISKVKIMINIYIFKGEIINYCIKLKNILEFSNCCSIKVRFIKLS